MILHMRKRPKRHVVIIGNGIAGISCARHLRKQTEDKITLISSETPHFFSRTALMYIYMGHMTYDHTKPYEDSFWIKHKIDLLHDRVKSIAFEKKRLSLERTRDVFYDELVLATGSTPRFLGWPGQDLKGAQALYSYQDLQEMEKNTQNIQRAVVIGGGLIGIEMAEMLHSRDIHVVYLVRENSFWGNILSEEESELIHQHLRTQNIDLRLNEELKEIQTKKGEGVEAVLTAKGTLIPCDFVGLCIGVRPNVDFLRKTDLEIGKGILVDEFLGTNIAHVHAIGDCAELKSPLPHRRAIEAVWYVGRMMGESLAHNLASQPKPYNPGVWFNSAKFFEIEYQVYGSVPRNPKTDEHVFFWRNLKENKSLRLIFGKEKGEIRGGQMLGLRQRHDVWEEWIRNEKHIKDLMESLEKANFDPEFFREYEVEIREEFGKAFPHLSVPSIPSGT
ncbi:MAG: FAD/NAD(P)-binding oxidoreductase [Cytophagales bacterium]|nr:FAD/NAD(P)-binding oxidoreductase [Cytophagales bacterium]